MYIRQAYVHLAEIGPRYTHDNPKSVTNDGKRGRRWRYVISLPGTDAGHLVTVIYDVYSALYKGLLRTRDAV